MPRLCATMQHHAYLAKDSANYRDRRRTVELQAHTLRAVARTEILTIPVVVHVLYTAAAENISDDQIASQIDVLNADFRMRNADAANIPAPFAPYAADCRIQFALANRDPAGQPSSGVTRTQVAHRFVYDTTLDDPTAPLDAAVKHAPSGADAWPASSYLNLWVCPLDGGLLGYAQFPGGKDETDGVVINVSAFGMGGTAVAPFDLGRTAVHEIGHWLNLLHIWGDDKGGCNRSDNVSDTPNQADSNFNVPAYPHVSCNNGPHGDMFMNFMDYSDDVALLMFTKGQAERINATLLGPRASLALSKGYVPPAGPAQPGLVLKTMAGMGPSAQKVFDGVDWI